MCKEKRKGMGKGIRERKLLKENSEHMKRMEKENESNVKEG